jgi:alpha-glucosidase
MYKPAGLNRTWPNLLGFEGVYGEENLSNGRLDMPLYDVTFPYIRQVSGPADYTPGAMRSAARHEPVRVARAGASQGTRSHQVALYVVVDQPLGILCDSPSLYEKEPLTTSYIASIPTVFDKTFVPCGRVGEYIVMARQKDGAWYLGGITNWDARDVNVDLSFLGEGSWKAVIYRDGANADSYGDDFIVSEAKVSAQESLPMHMAPGGGFAVIFTKE